MFVFLNSGCSAYLITPTLLNSLPVTHECLVLSLCCSAAAGEGRGEQGPASHVKNYKVDDLYQILRGSDKNDFKPKPKSSVYEFKGSGAMLESIPRTPNPCLAAASILKHPPPPHSPVSFLAVVQPPVPGSLTWAPAVLNVPSTMHPWFYVILAWASLLFPNCAKGASL